MNALADLGLEELMNESVSSVSKREQKLSQAPAAIHVITQEDIHRSGATTIPEVLRLAPGLSVAQLSANSWVVASRGFAAQFAGKLLVLIDGRAVYTPVYSGVYWDAQDLMLEDLDRIEIIRGPGATLWGANAVNGVINIITKKAGQTQGGLMTGGGGTEWYGGGTRYGGKISDDAHYRVYVKYDDHDALAEPGGHDAGDSWRKFQAGFRTDWQPYDAGGLTLQGDVFSSELNGTGYERFLTPPYALAHPSDDEITGGNVLGRWNHTFHEDSELMLQTFYDRNVRRNVPLDVEQDIYDAELQYRIGIGSRQTVVAGIGYRYTNLDVEDSFVLSFDGSRASSHMFNAFVQDEISLVEDRLSLSLGSKLEHNDFTGFEFQPSGRLIWTPNARNSIWGSVARAVRTPNFAEDRLRINHTAFDTDGPGPTPPTLLSIFPERSLSSETLLAYELGYRVRPTPRLYFDTAVFYNDYDDLVVDDFIGASMETTPPPPHLTLGSQHANRMRGETYGIEFAPIWQVTEDWTLSAGYSFLKMNLHSAAAGRGGEEIEGNSPEHQFQVRSLLDLPANLTLDASLFFVDRLRSQDVPSYARLDVRLGWRPIRDLEVSVGAMNLLEDQHAEFRSTSASPADVERSYYGKLTWRF